MNSANFVGNLTKDPNVKQVGENTVASFTVAVNWKSRDKEGADFIPVDVWGAQGESCGKYLHKGSKVGVSGEIKTRSWEDAEGKRQYGWSVNARRVEFLTPKSQSGDNGGNGGGGGGEYDGPPAGGDGDDDMPF